MQDMATALAWGVDGIQTTTPDRALNLLATPDCMDQVDNDLDGLTDYPEDPGCASPGDPSEVMLPPRVPALSPAAITACAAILATLASARRREKRLGP